MVETRDVTKKCLPTVTVMQKKEETERLNEYDVSAVPICRK